MTIGANLLLALAAGALFNLTPCVLSALAIKLRSIARVVGSGTRQRVLAALALLAGTLTFSAHWPWRPPRGTGPGAPLVRPGLLARIPRSESWLRRVQQVMGLILLAGATFFATTVLEARFGALLWAGWLGVLTFWLFRALVAGPGFGAALVPTRVLVVVAISATTVGFDRNDSTRRGLSWQPLTDRALKAARRAGRPVLVEFTADWCINCKVLERTVYADHAVARAVESTNMRLLRADAAQRRPRRGLARVRRRRPAVCRDPRAGRRDS